jgi:hypothetical protein
MGPGDSAEEKMRRLLTGAALLLPALACLVPAAARAADPAFCQGYAQAAINQVRGGLSNPGCVGGMQGARWSSDFRVHYNWCLTQPPAAAEAERGARTGYLRACRGM